MASLSAEYMYQSQLPFMLVKITEKDVFAARPGSMSRMQSKLCDMIWMMKTQISADPEWSACHEAIREFQLERLVWSKFWKEDEFPGEYPTRINPITFHPPASNIDKSIPKPSLTAWVAERDQCLGSLPDEMPHYDNLPSSLISFQDYVDPPIEVPTPQSDLQISSLHGAYDNSQSCALQTPPPACNFHTTTKQDHGIPATAHPAELGISARMIKNIVNRIKDYKPASYVPQHGWDAITGLPRYSVLNIARDAEKNWYGKGGEHFRHLLHEFYPFRIQFQKLAGGKIIAWPEAANMPLHVGGETWLKFRQLWACLRTWAEHGNSTGQSENIVQHMEHCKSVWMNFDTTQMAFPPDQETGYVEGGHENGGYVEVEHVEVEHAEVKQVGMEYGQGS